MMLSHLAAHLYGVPLMIHRLKLDTILSVLGQRIGLSRGVAMPTVDLKEIAQANPISTSGIAVIPVYGTLVRRTLGLEAQSGLISYSTIGTQISMALADPSIAAILLDIDSSGGEAGGAFDLADAIYASRGKKPIWAVANDSCFSAAYAIGSAADKVFVTRTGGVGSIGVIALHVDQSQADAKDGLNYSAIYAGAHKNDLSPHAPLSDGAQSSLQGEVNRIYDLFTQTVARNRQCSTDYVRQTDASLFFGPDAVTAGLADGVANICDVLAQLNQMISNPLAAMSALPLLKKEIQMQNTETPPVPVTESPQPAAPITATPIAVVPPPATGPQYDQAVEIAQLCQLAGMSDKTADYLASGQPVAQVRQSLLSAKAAVPAISSHIDPMQSAPRADMLVNMMKQRIGGVK